MGLTGLKTSPESGRPPRRLPVADLPSKVGVDELGLLCRASSPSKEQTTSGKYSPGETPSVSSESPGSGDLGDGTKREERRLQTLGLSGSRMGSGACVTCVVSSNPSLLQLSEEMDQAA